MKFLYKVYFDDGVSYALLKLLEMSSAGLAGSNQNQEGPLFWTPPSLQRAVHSLNLPTTPRLLVIFS